MRQGRYRNAASLLRQAAAAGDPWGAYAYGHCLRHGLGLRRSPLLAFKWLHSAAKRGVAPAQFSVGVCYSFGEGVSEDKREAILWYRRAARGGDADAAYNAGFFYEFGIGGAAQNGRKAAYYYRQAIRSGDSTALVSLGNMYLYGRGVRSDEEKAFRLYKIAARKGNVLGMYNVALAYLDRGDPGGHRWGVYWLRRAAKDGFRAAAKELKKVRTTSGRARSSGT